VLLYTHVAHNYAAVKSIENILNKCKWDGSGKEMNLFLKMAREAAEKVQAITAQPAAATKGRKVDLSS